MTTLRTNVLWRWTVNTVEECTTTLEALEEIWPGRSILKSSWALATNGEPSHNLSETSPVRGLNMAHGDGIGTTFLKQFGLSFVTLYEYVAAA